jgi:hypothetical protein
MSRSKRARRRHRQQRANKQPLVVQQVLSQGKDGQQNLHCLTCAASVVLADLHQKEIKTISALTFNKARQWTQRYSRFRIRWRKAGLLMAVVSVLFLIFEVEYVQHLAIAILIENLIMKFGSGAVDVAEAASAA